MRTVIGSDHAGSELKTTLAKFLHELADNVLDVGTSSWKRVAGSWFRVSRQSAWLNYIHRSLIASGELKRWIDEDGLGGVTSNPIWRMSKAAG
jgi:hypothetical protein